MDNKLSWTDHVTHIESKVKKFQVDCESLLKQGII